MVRLLAIFAFLSLVGLPTVSRAADAPAKSDGPTLMVRVQSIDHLLKNAEYVAALIGEAESAKQLLGFVRALAGENGLEGVDINQPFVVYANLAPEMSKTEGILMIPIKNKDSFVGMLKNRLNLEVKEDKDGIFSTEIPNNQGTTHFRFANGYVYGTYLNKDHIALNKLPKPADVIGTGDSVLSVSFRVDRLPEEMKKFALGAIETKLAEGKEKPLPHETPPIKELKNKFIDSVAMGVKAVLFEGEEITFKIDVDGKSEELALEFDLTAKKGTELAKDIAELKTNKSVAFGSLAARNPALLLAFNASLPASVKKVLGPAADDLTKMGLEMLPDDAQEILAPLVKALGPTLKSGDVDGGVAVLGPNADDKFTIVAAGKIAAGKSVEQAVKDVVGKLPDMFKSLVEFDAESTGPAKLHAVRVKDKLDDNAKKIVGESDGWLTFRNDAVLAAIGPDAEKALKAASGSAPAAGSVAKFEVSISRLASLARTDAEKTAFKDAFGNNPTGDAVTLSLDGGDSLRLRVAVKGNAVKFAVLMKKAKGN